MVSASSVTVMETARGGMLRRGLGVARADAAAVLNVAEDHLGEFGVRQGRDSHVATTHFALGARFARVDAGARLEGEGGHHALNGLYVCDGDDHVDHHTTLDHAVPHCTSHELYKGILDGSARAVFNGRIIVDQDAAYASLVITNQHLNQQQQPQPSLVEAYLDQSILYRQKGRGR